PSGVKGKSGTNSVAVARREGPARDGRAGRRLEVRNAGVGLVRVVLGRAVRARMVVRHRRAVVRLQLRLALRLRRAVSSDEVGARLGRRVVALVDARAHVDLEGVAEGDGRGGAATGDQPG